MKDIAEDACERMNFHAFREPLGHFKYFQKLLWSRSILVVHYFCRKKL